MNVSGIVASISQPRLATRSSNNCAPVHHVIQNSTSAATALGIRIAASVSPSTAIEAPCSQWNNTGLSI